jgi:hypothetical protein
MRQCPFVPRVLSGQDVIFPPTNVSWREENTFDGPPVLPAIHLSFPETQPTPEQ